MRGIVVSFKKDDVIVFTDEGRQGEIGIIHFHHAGDSSVGVLAGYSDYWEHYMGLIVDEDCIQKIGVL